MDFSELQLEEKLTGLKDLDVPNLKMGEVERLPAVSGGAEGGGDGGGRLPRRIALITAVLALAIAGCDDGKSRKESAQEKWDKIRAKRSATTDYPAETEDPEFRVAGDEPKVLGKKEDEDGLDPDGSDDDPMSGMKKMFEASEKKNDIPNSISDNEIVNYSGFACGEIKVEKLSEIQTLNAKLEKRLSDRRLRKCSTKLGKGEVRVFKYEYYKDLLTPQEYYDYVSSLVESPEDIVRVLRPLVEYKGGTPLTFPKDIITDEGNCSCQAMVAKHLLRDLGCREGDHDYDAKVMAIRHADHAICIFVGKDGKRYAIDQEAPVEGFDDIVEASPPFKKMKGKKIETYELVLGQKGQEIIFDVDPESFDSLYTYMDVVFDADMVDLASFNPDEELPSDWKKYKKVIVRVREECEIYYRHGALTQKKYEKTDIVEIFDRESGWLRCKKYPDKSEEYFNKDGVIISKRHPNGVYENLDEATGKVEYRKYPDKTEEWYDVATGKLTRKTFPNDPKIKAERYDVSTGKVTDRRFSDDMLERYDITTGKIKEKRYPDKTVEYFDIETGKLKAKVFSDGVYERYDIATGKLKTRQYNDKLTLFYDIETGEIVQKTHPDKKIELFDKHGRLVQVNHPDGKVVYYDGFGKVLRESWGKPSQAPVAR